MKIRKGDSVIIISGKDKLKKGKVLKVFPKENKILIEGLNLRKKHIKPKKSGEKGQTIQISIPVNVAILTTWFDARFTLLAMATDTPHHVSIAFMVAASNQAANKYHTSAGSSSGPCSTNLPPLCS